jgi:hypothetical protein
MTVFDLLQIKPALQAHENGHVNGHENGHENCQERLETLGV